MCPIQMYLFIFHTFSTFYYTVILKARHQVPLKADETMRGMQTGLEEALFIFSQWGKVSQWSSLLSRRILVLMLYFVVMADTGAESAKGKKKKKLTVIERELPG